MKIIAFANSDMKDYLEIKAESDCESFDQFSGTRYIVTYNQGVYWESNLGNETHEYRVLYPAWEMFKALLKRYHFETVNLCENFVRDYEEYLDPDYDDHYTPSATAGDYSPSNPWDAPGMSIHDFI